MGDPHTSTSGEGGDRSGSAEHRMPRWVKGFIVVAVLMGVLLALVALGGGEHGPSRHAPGGGAMLDGTRDGHRSPVEG